ncbi:response regulator transcription factor [Cellulomonas endophytica]|uniref:response regulator transcription factor n=1 Tax=Cellulomonas endophytica TaxID=2494735 RepID=UPI00196A4012|nr:helix-turn-helix transcriptional regulator [Cellulomonas endophytica]
MLPDARWRTVQAVGLELLEVTDPQEQATAALHALLRLVPADVAGELVIDPAAGRAVAREVPDLLMPAAPAEGLDEVLATNPAVPHLLRHGTLPATRVEDLCGPEAWARNPMRRELLDPQGVPHAVLTARVEAPAGGPGVVHGFGLNRSRPFSDEERDVLGAFEPYLWLALRQRRRLGLLHDLELAVAGGGGLLVVRGDGGPPHLNARADELLQRHGLTPADVVRLCRTAVPPGGQGALRTRHGVLRLRRRPAEAGRLAVVLDEVRAAPGTAAGEPLTRRQHVVLCHASHGLTAAAIARRLGLRPRTVEKHLEHVYRALGASDRLDAVRRARERGLLPVLDGCDHLPG